MIIVAVQVYRVVTLSTARGQDNEKDARKGEERREELDWRDALAQPQCREEQGPQARGGGDDGDGGDGGQLEANVKKELVRKVDEAEA